MVKIISILLIICFVDVRAQFFDFLSAFQPPTLRPIFEPTKPPRTTRFHDPNRSQNASWKLGQTSEVTTAKTIRKTPKNNRRSQNKTKKIKENYAPDKISFDDGYNTIINYDSVKHTTVNPFARPGVKPAIVNGPPITNRPVTKSFVPRPIAGLQPQDDSTLTPELIVGPDEDYMSIVERRRFMEFTEKKCEQYVSLDTVRVEAIPLVPSPRPVVVNVSSCARSVPLVVGGSVVTIQQFPHMALLGWTKMRSGGYLWKCGGSLVSERYVLTAAHCAYQDKDDSVVSGPPRAVQLGSSRRDDPGAIVIRVSSVIRHPKYRPPQSYYDIAIVKMMKNVKFSAVIKPACLGVPPAAGKHIIATGWGKTEFGGDESELLRGVSLPVWSLEECASVLGESRKLPRGPDRSQTCAGDRRGGKDTCQGDSGGPAQLREGCSWRVVAVTSTGRACGAIDTPAIYANVQIPFIAKVIFGDEIRNEGNLNTDQENQWNSGYSGENGQNKDNKQNNSAQNNNRPNVDRVQNDYNRPSVDRVQNNYNRPSVDSVQNNYNRPSGDRVQNDYNRPSGDRVQNDYNRPSADRLQNNYNRPSVDRVQNDYNRPSVDSVQNDYNQPSADRVQNNYNRPSVDRVQNDYNRPSGDRVQNDYNRPSGDRVQNDYNRPSGDRVQNDYNRPSGDRVQNNYNRPSVDRVQNDYNRPSGDRVQNNYNRPSVDNVQNNYNRQNNQWYQQPTSNPLNNDNYQNPVYRGDDTEDSTIGPHYYFEDSVNRPYIGNIWQT
ncbi:unnamed protein product [Danaus chrysippus]|uniref:(African queen) hypothetical protein n=1 Tax=Danaus chrysippus TaxID=151541 RepID=A0A8J2RD66_9NEOP|nr:unnamed protein product [Danaus chrysippus]